MVDARRNVERIAPVVAKFVRFVVAETNNGSEPCLDELELWTEDGRNVAWMRRQLPRVTIQAIRYIS